MLYTGGMVSNGQDTPGADVLMQQLRQTPMFAQLDTAVMQVLALEATYRRYRAGETLFWEGDPASGMYLLHSGWVKAVKVSPSGREQVVRYLEPGELFHEIGVLANQPSPATAVALENAGVWLIPRSALLVVLQRHPELAQFLIEQLAGRVLHLLELVADLSLRSVKERLARMLLADQREETLHRPSWYTQAELAARLGTVPDVIQRALRGLAEEGIIAVQRQRILIQDMAQLEKIAGE